jgi:Flp pilus assembly protein TadD
MPGSHEIDDTLGWAYYKKGNGAAAVIALRTAVDAQPDNPIYLYHLGAAYALAKDWSRARTTLARLQGREDFDGADDARRILASLK